jgi:hypothetical protein
MFTLTRLEAIRSYRHLYKALLKAVQYSHPARTICRDQLRDAYRNEPQSNYNPVKIARTLEFLDGAARERGMEHKILKNLLHTRYLHKMKYECHTLTHVITTDSCSSANIQNFGQNRSLKGQQKDLNAMRIKKTAYLHYDMTLAMLNDSMNLCLR